MIIKIFIGIKTEEIEEDDPRLNEDKPSLSIATERGDHPKVCLDTCNTWHDSEMLTPHVWCPEIREGTPPNNQLAHTLVKVAGKIIFSFFI